MAVKLKLFLQSVLWMTISIFSLSAASPVLADQFDTKIQALRQTIDASRGQVTVLKQQQDTLQNALATINAQIAETNSQLELTNLRSLKTNSEIDKTKLLIVGKKALLAENIKLIYQQSQITTIEMLATSGNFGDFLDRQQYLDKLKDRLGDTLAEMAVAKQKLEEQQAQLSNLMSQQKGLAYGLSIQQNQSANLLSQTQGQEANYQAKIKNDEQQVVTLRSQQAAEIASRQTRATYGGTGGYPWTGYSLDGGVDPWGYYYRECTSYSAWRRANIGKALPSWGQMGPANAKTWVSWARQFGYSVDGNPRVGDVAVITSGFYGHVMIVEQVLGGGQIKVSQYNANWDGRYSEAVVSTAGIYFIH